MTVPCDDGLAAGSKPKCVTWSVPTFSRIYGLARMNAVLGRQYDIAAAAF